MNPRVLVIEHADVCPPALLGNWLVEQGLELDVCRPWAGQPLPDLAGYAGVVVLGGPMGADDDETHAWLGPTKRLIRTAVAADVPLLGVCLGHQLIASALGGRVAPNASGQQLGLLDVGWTSDAGDDALVGPLATPRRGVHFNNDVVVELPEGAVVLARAPEGQLQVVRFGPRAWGVQLHPEVDSDVVASWAISERGSHAGPVVDQAEVLRLIGEARHELDQAWRPLAASFARLAGVAGVGS